MPKPEPDKVQIGPDDAAHPPKKIGLFSFFPFLCLLLPLFCPDTKSSYGIYMQECCTVSFLNRVLGGALAANVFLLHNLSSQKQSHGNIFDKADDDVVHN